MHADHQKLTEWIARRTEVLEQVKGLIIERLEIPVDPDAIDPDTPLFGTGLALDSVDTLDLVVAITDTFDIDLENRRDAIVAMRTMNTLVDNILATSGSGPASAKTEAS